MEIKKNLVSIIGTSFKNNPVEIEKSINSVFNQSYKNIEFIVVLPPFNNNLDLFKKYKKIKIILTKKLLNISDSLDIALKIARGEFIARLDFDDIYLRDKIKKQVNYLKKNQNVSILGTGIINKFSLKKKLFPTSNLMIKIYTFFFNPICHPSVVMRKNILKKGLTYKKNFYYSEDLELWLNALSQNIKISNINEVLIVYNQRQFIRTKKNFLFNLKARKLHSKKIYGYFLGNINIFFFYIFCNFFNKFLLKIQHLITKK